MESSRVFTGETPVTLEQVLAAKEERAAAQKELLSRYEQPLVSFTLNLPGSRKLYPLALRAFTEGCGQIASALKEQGWETIFHTARSGMAGYEGFYVVGADARDVKGVMMSIEDTHPLGRLFDIDVLRLDGVPLKGDAQGRPERACLVCGKPVWSCARSCAHSAEDLALRAYSLLWRFFLSQYADEIAADAQTALLYEVAVTPKPGLVDQANNGAHTDMNLYTFLRSGSVLGSYFRDCVKAGANHKGGIETLLSSARHLGIRAERNMLRVTGGVNTHRGAIFSLGIVCLAMGWLWGLNQPVTPELCLKTCSLIAGGCLAELESEAETHGLECYRRYGLQGIRGEAASGFPHVWRYGLPALTEALDAGYSLNDAGVTAFLHLLARVPDTCAIHRADQERLAEVQAQIQEFFAGHPGMNEVLHYADALDKHLIRENISPGGCADLLALSFFLHFSTNDSKKAQSHDSMPHQE